VDFERISLKRLVVSSAWYVEEELCLRCSGKNKKFGQGHLFEVVNSILKKGPPAGERSRGLGAPRTLPFLNGGLRPHAARLLSCLLNFEVVTIGEIDTGQRRI
jgi:hypothetical protein